MQNLKFAFSSIMAHKMRSFLTMLGIIIGIGSVISIVSIGDTMRGLFQDLYKDVGITQAYIQIGYWIDDVRMTDYFTLDELDRAKEVFHDKISYMDSDAYASTEAVYARNKVKEVFGDEVAYIDSSAYLSTDVQAGRTKMKFEFTGIDYNYQDVQPVDVIYGRYLNEGDVLGRRKNLVMEAKSAEKLFGTENAVGKSLRMTVYGETDEYTVVGVYKKEMNAFQALMMGTGSDTGAAFIPYTILTWPNDNFYSCRLFAADDVDMTDFMNRLMAYIAKQKDRKPEDFYSQTAVDEMGSVDSMMGALSAAVGGIAAISLLVGGIGIMNIMLVSVTERTREIGIRKALGARTRDVLIQFLTESAILSACGGIIGVVLAVSVVSLGGMALGLPVVIKPGIIFLAVGFSAVVGIFFGIYPASRAAKADPIDALRYE